MKPLHASFKWLSRCPCCQTKYSKHRSGKNTNHGKTSARMRAKNAIKKELNES